MIILFVIYVINYTIIVAFFIRPSIFQHIENWTKPEILIIGRNRQDVHRRDVPTRAWRSRQSADCRTQVGINQLMSNCRRLTTRDGDGYLAGFYVTWQNFGFRVQFSMCWNMEGLSRTVDKIDLTVIRSTRKAIIIQTGVSVNSIVW